MENIKNNLTVKKEIPSPQFNEQISKFVESAIEKSGWSFSCEEVQLTTEEVSSVDGLLPLIVWIAGQTLEKIWGPQELVFRCDSEALCGVVPELRRPILPSSLWLYAIHYELEKVASNEYNLDNKKEDNYTIDDWFKRWNNALKDKKILLMAPLQPSHTRGAQGNS